ncbi:hypothetical protein D3C76_1530580 [compost metagenome]
MILHRFDPDLQLVSANTGGEGSSGYFPILHKHKAGSFREEMCSIPPKKSGDHALLQCCKMFSGHTGYPRVLPAGICFRGRKERTVQDKINSGVALNDSGAMCIL